MNILILTEEGGLLGLADRFSREGNVVKVFAPIKETGKGIYTLIKSNEIPSAIKWCKFIVSDWKQPESFYEKISMFNKPIVGVNHHANILNEDAIKEHVVMEKMGVFMPESKIVIDVADIYKILLQWNIPSYDIRFGRDWFDGSHRSFMNWAVSKVPPGEPILLQRPIDGDVDVQVIGLWNGLNWVGPFFTTTWDNSLGSAVVFPLVDGNQLAVQNLNKIDQYLRMIDYHGPVSARLTLRDEQVYCRELFVGIRTPEIYAILENLHTPSAALFHALAFSVDATPQLFGKMSAAVEVTADNHKNMHGAPVLNMEQPEKIRHIFPGGVMRSDLKKDEYFISGDIPVVYTVTAHEANVKELRNRIQRTISNTEFPGMRFNLTLLNQVTRMMLFLKNRNYLNAA